MPYDFIILTLSYRISEASKIETAKTILVVDDEIRIQRMLKDFLKGNEYEVIEAGNGQDALDIYFNNDDKINLILLDVMMPRKDGYTVLKEIREYSQVPVIMLTARSEEYDQIGYYSHGADDFVAKPFSPNLLLAHMEAVLKRCYPKGKPLLEVGVLLLDEEKREFTLGSEKLELTPKEYDLLFYFMQNTGLVLTRDVILDAVWERDYEGDFRTVDTHVKQLRAKLFVYSSYIKTIHGVGYRFEVGDV